MLAQPFAQDTSPTSFPSTVIGPPESPWKRTERRFKFDTSGDGRVARSFGFRRPGRRLPASVGIVIALATVIDICVQLPSEMKLFSVNDSLGSRSISHSTNCIRIALSGEKCLHERYIENVCRKRRTVKTTTNEDAVRRDSMRTYVARSLHSLRVVSAHLRVVNVVSKILVLCPAVFLISDIDVHALQVIGTRSTLLQFRNDCIIICHVSGFSHVCTKHLNTLNGNYDAEFPLSQCLSASLLHQLLFEAYK